MSIKDDIKDMIRNGIPLPPEIAREIRKDMLTQESDEWMNAELGKYKDSEFCEWKVLDNGDSNGWSGCDQWNGIINLNEKWIFCPFCGLKIKQIPDVFIER